jgi:hypothetical protein
MSTGDVLRRWRDDPEFRSFFNGVLAEAPFRAVRWETPAVTRATVEHPFEFTLLDCPGLRIRANPAPFARHIEGAPLGAVITFANLGGDALLVVPTPRGPANAYGHLAAFVRTAPEEQRHALWQQVAGAMGRRLGDRPVWLSTAGDGVAWLHIRLDDRPKYYWHGPYRQVSG